jgi:competence protein CoiA
MRYSLVNGERSEAQPGLAGQCPACDRVTIAKCGEVKIWHWAHSGQKMCDPWWENETEWHRNWKSCFPVDWQEVTQKDNNGEKHIADVKTDQGWVLEFQYSFLKPEERRARNAFYEKLVWVVNGTRRVRDKTQFFKLLNELNPMTTSPHMRKIYLDECALLKEWAGIHAPVLFDFEEEILWCLLPVSQNMWGYIVAFPRSEFIELHNKNADQPKNFEDCLNNLNTLANLISQKLKQEYERLYTLPANLLGLGRGARPRF